MAPPRRSGEIPLKYSIIDSGISSGFNYQKHQCFHSVKIFAFLESES